MKTLEEIRKKIDGIDEQILDLLQERFLCSKEVADIKKEAGLPIFDRVREEQLFARIESLAEKKSIPKGVAKALFTEIVHQSRRMQEVRGASFRKTFLPQKNQ